MKNEERNLPKEAMRELAEKALQYKFFGFNRNDKPGEFFQRLGPVKKHILKDLKSDDISDVRWLK